MSRSIRNTYFDPNYSEIKYITEDTSLYALHLHGYISTFLENRLSAFTTIGEVIDSDMVDLMKEPGFGYGCRKELTAFFVENQGKFKLKSHKAASKKNDKSQDRIKALEKKLIKYEEELHSQVEEKYKVNDALDSCNLELTSHKGLETTLYEEIETLKKSTELAKIEYDNYYKDRIEHLNQLVKDKDIQIGALKLSNNNHILQRSLYSSTGDEK